MRCASRFYRQREEIVMFKSLLLTAGVAVLLTAPALHAQTSSAPDNWRDRVHDPIDATCGKISGKATTARHVRITVTSAPTSATAGRTAATSGTTGGICAAIATAVEPRGGGIRRPLTRHCCRLGLSAHGGPSHAACPHP